MFISFLQLLGCDGRPALHPNLYLEFPLTDARAVGPLSWLKRVKGFEYWSAFTAGGKANYTPVAGDSLFIPWGVGDETMDGTLVYPAADGGVLSSMRLESLRDGIEELECVQHTHTKARPDCYSLTLHAGGWWCWIDTCTCSRADVQTLRCCRPRSYG